MAIHGYRAMYVDKFYELYSAVIVGDVSQELSFIYSYKNVYSDKLTL